MPSPFGQSADYSSVFASLGREELSQIASATRNAANQSANDQNAADQEAQSKWKAGQISDSEWLDYIRQRLAAASGDPEEQQKWADALRVNESAIEDSQFETKFQLGKITAQALLSHYNQRMGSVEENSPAYRDLASRYQQVVDYIKGGSGGGSGRSGGGRSGSSAGMVAASAKGNTPGGSTSASGYDQSGPDVVPPSSVFFGTGDIKYYIKTLLADQDRIKSMMDQYKRDPTLQSLVDPLSGSVTPVSPDLLRSLDNQFLRNQDNLSSAYSTQGDPQKYTAALTAKTDYISTYMVDHNTDKIETAYTEFQKSQVALFKSASDLPPDQRIAIYAKSAQMTKDFVNGAFPGEGGVGLRQFLGTSDSRALETSTSEKTGKGVAVTRDLPPEMKSSGALWNVLEGWSFLGQIGADPNLSDADRSSLAEDAVRLIPGSTEPTTAVGTRGERNRLTEKDVHDLIYANPLDPTADASVQSLVGHSYTGIFASIIQREGMNNVDPSYDGPRFVYQVNQDGSHQIATADASSDATGTGLLLSPKGQDRSTAIQTAIKVDGQTVLAFAKPTNIPVNLLPPGMAVYASDGSIQVPDGKGGIKSIPAGTLVPSDVIKAQESAHPGWFQGLVRTGALVKTSPVWGVLIDNPGSSKPVIWYQDAKSGTLSRVPPHLDTNQTDSVTKGVMVGIDNQPAFNDVPFAGGSVVAFGAGFTNGEMRNFIRNQVASGGIDLNDFKTRGAGTSIGGPPTIDDVLEPFKSTPAELHQAQGLHGAKGWGKEHDALQSGLEQQRKDKSKAWLAQNMPSAVNSPMAVDAISSIAGFLGIKISGDYPTSHKAPAQPIDPSVAARKDAMDAMGARRSVALTPRLGLAAVTPPPGARWAPLSPRTDLTSPNPAPVVGPKPLGVVPAPKVTLTKAQVQKANLVQHGRLEK